MTWPTTVFCGKMLPFEWRAVRLLELLALLLFLGLTRARFCEGRSSEWRRSRSCSVLQLLNVQPYPDDGLFAGFDRGLELVPAAHLAADEINNRSDILAGFDLEIVDIDSEACGRGTITKGLVNFFRKLVSQDDPSRCVVGVIGFVCSSVTNVLAPIINNQNIAYLTLANSVSPAHRNTVKYPNLFHTLSSSSVHNTVLISLMQSFGWKRIGVVYDSLSIFFRSTANDFIQRVVNSTEAEISITFPITTSESIEGAFKIINSEAARVTYWLGNDGQNALCLCEAYRNRFLYPGHVFILRYHENIVDNILNANTACSKDELTSAMKGVLMMDYRLYVENDTVLFSRWNYSEFRRRYAEKLRGFSSDINTNLSTNMYASSFYDQVWSFALALNSSLPFVETHNLSFSDYTIGNTEAMTRIIRNELMSLSFQGASGWIKFNEDNEIPSSVNIFQVMNGTPTLVAIYDPIEQNISFIQSIEQSIPSDTFDTVHTLLPTWLIITIFTAQAILFGLITTNTLLLVVWRKEKLIKATSPVLSVLMMIGCYLLWVAPLLQVLSQYGMVAVTNMKLLTLICNAEVWSWIGMDLIFATLLVKMFRIYTIFRAKQMTLMSNYWLDKYLLLYILVMCIGKLIILAVLTVVIPIQPNISTQYVVALQKTPYYAERTYCSSKSPEVWLAVTLVYSGVLLFMVMLLAILTRHIRNSEYKDTKKVNVFIFIVVMTLAITILLWLVFSSLEIEIGGNITEWLTSFSVAMLCQVCIFVPKLLPLAIKKIFGGRARKLKPCSIHNGLFIHLHLL